MHMTFKVLLSCYVLIDVLYLTTYTVSSGSVLLQFFPAEWPLRFTTLLVYRELRIPLTFILYVIVASDYLFKGFFVHL